jgi:phthalate 4,5-dioxygenase oxygenase subunit
LLTKEENELITRVGHGTPMGELIRRCWTPACLSEELPEPDGDPIRIRLLGEDLVAFRDSAGRVGVMEEHCPHRGASLFFGRNEEGGLRCLYHGWKIDVAGTILETPCEPADSRMRLHIKHEAYPVVEAGDIVWVYLGPRDEQPPFPNLWWVGLPANRRCIGKIDYECNFVQAMEGVWDSTHSNVLHTGFDLMHWTPEQFAQLSAREYSFYPTTGMSEAQDTDYGFRAATIEPTSDGRKAVSVRPFIVPFHCLLESVPHMFVPSDDEHTWLYDVRASADRPVDREASLAYRGERVGIDVGPDHHKFRTFRNNYLQDRRAQRERKETWSYTGMPWGKPHQDMAVTESMGPIWDRTREHLGVADFGVVALRARLLKAVCNFMETGKVAETNPSTPFERIMGVKATVPADVPWESVGAHAGESVPGLV